MEYRMGFQLPYKCLRGSNDCHPLSQIESDCGTSFLCCGENDGSKRFVEQDKYTLCFKSEYIDQISFNDKRDLIHQASVIMGALAIIEEEDCDAYHKP